MAFSKENMMQYHFYRNYRIIRVMFWAFPYLLWQAFGHWSGFLVGVVVSVALTAMFNSLFHASHGKVTSSDKQQTHQVVEPQSPYQEEYREEAEPYQRGYRAQEELYRAGPQLYQAGAIQPQYEEMQVPYPQEVMPPMEQK